MNLIMCRQIPGRIKKFLIQRQMCTNLSRFNNNPRCNVLVVGAGSGGVTIAAKISSRLGPGNVVLLDAAKKHYYQPMFTLVGGGMKNINDTFKFMQEVIPINVLWIAENVEEFHPRNNSVITSSGKEIKYNIMIVATGLVLNYDKIPGLVEALSIPNGNVSSIYSPKYANRTYKNLERFVKGNAVFTFPASPVKCPGAPQKIAYISEHYLRKNNKRKDAQIIYNTSLPVIFGVKRYADALWEIVEERNIQINLQRNLIEVQPNKNIAIFEDLKDPSKKYETEYTMLHVTPPMSTISQLSNCKDLVNEAGFVDVKKNTLQHVRFDNIFAIGDCSSTPNSKTAASVAAQSPVVCNNVFAVLQGKDLKDNYNGYASCPLVTGYNSCILAEFDYDLTPLETFPIPQNKERYSMFLMKKDIMPYLYWNIMLHGYWNGPAFMRKLMSPFRIS